MSQEIWVQKECYEGKIWVVTGLFSGSTGVGHTGDFLEEMRSLSGSLGKPGRSPPISSHSRSCDLTVPFITGSSSSTLLSLGMCPSEGFSDHKRKQKRWPSPHLSRSCLYWPYTSRSESPHSCSHTSPQINMGAAQVLIGLSNKSLK